MPSSTVSSRPLNAGRAVVLWVVYSVLFAIAGGLGAGIPSAVFSLTTGQSYDPTLYAIMFGVTGFLATRLAQRVAEG